jgi:hypothetical protein
MYFNVSGLAFALFFWLGKSIGAVFIKGTVQRDFKPVFLNIWKGPSLNKDPFWFKNYPEATTTLDQRPLSLRG